MAKRLTLQEIELRTYHDRAKVLVEEALEATVRLENCCERIQLKKERRQASVARQSLMRAKNDLLSFLREL